MKVVFIVFILTAIVSLTIQAGADLFISKCNSSINFDTCCVQTAQILALASASADASASAFAAAHACASICTSAAVSASVAVIASAEVAITQSISISTNTGTCCEIDTKVKAQARSSATASASAYADAVATAAAAVRARAGAVAAANSAASIYSQVSALINSSCCSFTAEFSSTISIIGSFVANAKAAADASIALESQIHVVTSACATASSQAFASADAVVFNALDNCCKNTRVTAQANQTATQSAELTTKVNKFVGLIANAFSSVKAASNHVDSIMSSATLSDRLCANECRTVPFSCCANVATCKPRNQTTVCDVGAQLSIKGFLAASAKARAVATANGYVETGAAAMTDLLTKTLASAKAAVFVSSTITVSVEGCCSITVVIDNDAKARATAIAAAYSSARAVAFAYANATAASAALASSASSARAGIFASAKLFSDGDSCGLNCCSPRTYPSSSDDCCTITTTCVGSFIYAGARDCDSAVSYAYSNVQKGIRVATAVRASTVADVMARSSTRLTYKLRCCCC